MLERLNIITWLRSRDLRDRIYYNYKTSLNSYLRGIK